MPATGLYETATAICRHAGVITGVARIICTDCDGINGVAAFITPDDAGLNAVHASINKLAVVESATRASIYEPCVIIEGRYDSIDGHDGCKGTANRILHGITEPVCEFHVG